MATGSRMAAYRMFQDLFTNGTCRDRRDGDLLDAFLDRRDESAFAILLVRHGPLVWSTAQRTLDDKSLAEDVFQAVFLVLLSKAHTIRAGAALSSWLYRVTRRLSTQANEEFRTRRSREQPIDPIHFSTAQGPPTSQDSCRSIYAEIDRLPARYRDPVLLCCVEGLTYLDAARRLEWSEGTLRNRLSKARAVLRSRLLRKGVILGSAGMLFDSSALRGLSQAVPVQTLASAKLFVEGRNIATGLISTVVVKLVRLGALSITLARLKQVAAVLLLVSGFGGAAFALRTMEEPMAPHSEVSVASARNIQADSKSKDVAVDITLQGSVAGPDGKPVHDAEIQLTYLPPRLSKAPSETAALVLASTKTGDDGRYRLTFKESDRRKLFIESRPGRVYVVASKGEMGPDWRDFDEVDDPTDVSFELVRDDVAVRGVVKNLEGRPVSNAHVGIGSTQIVQDPPAFLRAVEMGTLSSQTGKQRIVHVGAFPGQPAEVLTDASGLFELKGFGRDRLVSLRIQGPGIQDASLQVLVRRGRAVVGPKLELQPKPRVIHGSTFEYVAATSRIVTGTIRDKQTKRPIEGVMIESYNGLSTAVSDQEGRFRLDGLARQSSYRLVTWPSKTQKAYHAAELTVSDAPGAEPVEATIECEPALAIRARVFDKQTHQPVSAQVFYMPIHPNPNVKPGEKLGMLGTAYPTGEGTHLAHGWPGPGMVCVRTFDPSYLYVHADPRRHFPEIAGNEKLYGDEKNVLIEFGSNFQTLTTSQFQGITFINPPTDAKDIEVEVLVEKGVSVEVRVDGPDGPIVGPISVNGVTEMLDRKRMFAKPTFAVQGLSSGHPRTVVVGDQPSQLAKAFVVAAEDGPSIDVKLEPSASITGKVLADDENLIERLLIWPNGKFESKGIKTGFQTPMVAVDKEGQFRIDGLPSNVVYDLQVEENRGFEIGIGHLVKDLKLTPGETKDLGELKISK